jgi:hypothetical protein
MTCIPRQIFTSDNIHENEMGGSYGTLGTEEKITECSGGNM